MGKKEESTQNGKKRKQYLGEKIQLQTSKKVRNRPKRKFDRRFKSDIKFISEKQDNKRVNEVTSRSIYLYGVLPVQCALTHRRRKLDHLFLKKVESSDRLNKIRMLAELIRIPISEVTLKELDEMCPNAVHQGVVLRCGDLDFLKISNLPQIKEGENQLIIALDQVEDPHNLGAILRTCSFFKVSAVVVPRDHTPGLTSSVSKASAGVSEWYPVISVPNLARFLQQQKSKGFWVIGLTGDAEESIVQFSQDCPLILVLGNEGKGLRWLSRKYCDRLLSIPGCPDVSSLNVSNAAAVMIFHLKYNSQSL